MKASSSKQGAQSVVPLIWPGLHIYKSLLLDSESPSTSEFCLREFSLPYTCEGFWVHGLGLAVICEIDNNLTVNEEGVTNIKEMLLSGWTVELDSKKKAQSAICTRNGPDGTYRFYVEVEKGEEVVPEEEFKEIKFSSATFGNDCDALVGDMKLTGSSFMRDLHKRDLLSSTKSVVIASKTHDFRGNEIKCLSIGGYSSELPKPDANTRALGRCPNFPVTVNVSSYLPVNPQAATYLQYRPIKPDKWNKWSIPSLGLSFKTKNDLVISQGLILLVETIQGIESTVVLSSDWRCFQMPGSLVAGIFKRTISNVEHVLQVYAYGSRYEEGKILIYGSYMQLRSRSFSHLEIVEGEIKSSFSPNDGKIN